MNESKYEIQGGQCSKCGKKVMIWGDLSKRLCMGCDSK